MRISGAIIACAAALGAMVMGASPASAQFVTSAGRIPTGYCVTDIATRAAVDNSVWHIYTSDLKDSTRQQVGYPLNHWDISSGTGSDGSKGSGYMNMSVKIGRISEGQCLTDARLSFAAKGLPPAPSSSEGDNPWSDRGGWPSRHFWQPTGNAKATGIVYTQKMTPKSTEIITGITVLYGGPCAPICLGTWKGEGGETYIQLAIAKTPYAPPAAPKPLTIAGRWNQISSCSGCTSTGFEIKYGKTEGKEVETGSETYKSLSLALGASYTGGTGAAAPVQQTVSVSATLTGTISKTQRESILNSVSQSVEATSKFDCQKGAVWQWLTEVTYDVGMPTKGRSNIYVCTGTDKAPPTNAGVSWTGE
jgi:hypothetical protein